MNRSCSLNPGQLKGLVVTTGCVGLLSYVASAFAIVAATGFYKAHQVFSQRLVLYLLISTLVYSGILVLQSELIYQNIQELCKSLAFLMQYAMWLKTSFIFWITVYLFTLAEFSRNLNKRKHEALYVVSSVLIPLPIACVPLFTNTYGPAGAWCWIKGTDSNCERLISGMIEQFALWYGPLIILTVLDVLAIIRIAYILCKRAWKYNREHRDPSLPNQNHRAALKEVLPLMAYPIIFHTTILIALADRAHTDLKNESFGLGLVHTIVTPSWGWLAAVTLLIHLHVLRKHKKENVHAPSFTEYEPSHAE